MSILKAAWAIVGNGSFYGLVLLTIINLAFLVLNVLAACSHRLVGLWLEGIVEKALLGQDTLGRDIGFAWDL